MTSEKNGATGTYEWSEEQARLFLRHVPAAVAMFDTEMRYLAASQRFADDYGLNVSEILGRTHYEVFPHAAPAWRETHLRVLGGSTERGESERYTRPDGAIDWLKWELRPWRDGQGAVGGLILYSEIVTERHQLLETLRRSKGRLRAIFEQAGVGICQADPESGRFLEVNETFCRILGYSREELLQRTFPEVSHPEEWEHDRALLAKLFNEGSGSGTREKRYVRKDGSLIWGRITVSLLRFGNEIITFGMLEDISERHAAEQKILDQQEKLQQLTLDTVMTEERERRKIAVELHDRIGQQLALAQIKLEGVRNAVPQHDKTRLDEAVALIAQSIADTRALSFELSPPILYDLGFGAALSWLVEDVERRTGLAIELDDGTPGVAIDEAIATLLLRVVRELLMNVVKHARTRAANVTTAGSETSLELVVTDDGAGWAADGCALSAGFGLFSAREQLGRIGGSLSIESTPGRGARVEMRVPLRLAPDQLNRGS